jgi:hypothetical protein
MADAALAGAQALQGGAAPDAALAGAQGLLAARASAPVAAPINTNPYLSNITARNDEQDRLEREHGKFATVATQAARGVLDFVMAPAALGAAGLESAGSLTGWDGLKDFGRGLGEAAQGSEAMATLFNPSVISSFGQGQEALTAYERTQRDIAEQQQAWPMLSTLSHAAGFTAAGLGVGALAGGAAAAGEGAAQTGTALGRVGSQAALGTYEGAAGSAQGAYADNRPLRDVLGATVMGGILGGVTAGGLQAAGEAFTSPAVAEGLEAFSRERAGKAIGIIQRDRNALGGSDQVDRLVKDVSGYVLDDGSTVLPKTLLKAGTISQEQIADRIAQGAQETGAKLGNMRRAVSDFVDTSAPELRPSVRGIVGKIKTDVLDSLEDDPILKSRSGAIKDVVEALEKKAGAGKDISINELRSVQESLGAKLYTKVIGAVPESKVELQKVERILADTIEHTVDKALPKMEAGEAGSYRDLRRLSHSFIQADDIASRAVGRQAGSRFHTLSDTLAGTATFAGDLATGGPILAGAKALGVSTLHKYAREHGSAFLSALTEKLAGASRKLGSSLGDGLESPEWLGGTAAAAGSIGSGAAAQYISVDAAGGREAQSVMTTLARARLAVNDHVEAAGPNPVARQAAQREAQARIADDLANKAGPFDPTTWQTIAPNPLQKVLHRPEILNQVSTDLAHGVAHAASLRPSPDFELNPDRVKKLTKDANGPLAIGNVQSAVKELATSAPPTPTGDQVKYVARQVLQRLASDDTSGAMTTGHELTRALSAMSPGARDDLSKGFLGRAVGQIQEQLSSAAFGKAGQIYSKLTTQVSDAANALTDPAAIREQLRSTQARGASPDALKELTTAVLDAHDAKKQLGGEGAGREIARQLKDLDDKFAKAQDAVTLDGGPAGRVFDFFSGKPGADATGIKGDPTTIVLNAIRPQMERLLPVLGHENDRYSGAPDRPTHPDPPKSSGELQALYSDRMQSLAQNVASPNTDAIAASMRGMPNVPPDVSAATAADSQQRMAQLLQDMPKPTQNVRGKAFETLSSADLRKANAMWEATTKPMSVFADFHAGTIDYDKAQYAWKQYPGLQQAAQAGLLDALHAHLSDDERASIPDSTLTQLDYLLGFNGTLQTSVDRGFASRMTAINDAQAQAKPQQNGPLELETSKPTYTERLAGAKG